jgi:hypothetical protein
LHHCRRKGNSVITHLDYGAGNVRSGINAIEKLGETARIVDAPEDIATAEGIVFPGVGAFGRPQSAADPKIATPVAAQAAEHCWNSGNDVIALNALAPERFKFGKIQHRRISIALFPVKSIKFGRI